MVEDARHTGAVRLRWLVVLAGPLAWAIDEAIALVIEADVCSATAPHSSVPTQSVLVAIALAALGAIALGAVSALRTRRALDASTSLRDGRMRFIAVAALLLAGVSAFGVVLRLVASLVGGVCA